MPTDQQIYEYNMTEQEREELQKIIADNGIELSLDAFPPLQPVSINKKASKKGSHRATTGVLSGSFISGAEMNVGPKPTQLMNTQPLNMR